MLSSHLRFKWSSSPSFPRHLHRHHSLAYVFVFSSQYMPIPLQPTFLHFLGYFSHLRCPSNSFIPNSVQLGDSTHESILTSSFPPHPTSSQDCAFFTPQVSAPYIIAGLTIILYTFPLTLKLILWSHRIPDILFQFVHTDCILCVFSASKSPFSANVAPTIPRYLNVFTHSKFCPCRLISEFPSKFPSTLNLMPAIGRHCVLALVDYVTVPGITSDCLRVAELFMRRRYFDLCVTASSRTMFTFENNVSCSSRDCSTLASNLW